MKRYLVALLFLASAAAQPYQPQPWLISGATIHYDNGGILAGSPSGGSKGAGTINGTIYDQGARVATTAELSAYLPLIGGPTNPLVGPLIVNLNSASAPPIISGAAAQFVGANGGVGFVENDTFAAAPIFTGRRADGTGSSPTTVQLNDVLAGLSARPYDGVAYATSSVANVQVLALENFTAAHHGAAVVMNCTAVTTLTITECGRFTSTGLTIGTQQTTQGNLVLANTAAGTYSTTIKSSNSASAAWTMTLPTTAGVSGYVLSTDGSGVTSWVVQGSTPAGGASTNVQFNSGSGFGGDSGFTYGSGSAALSTQLSVGTGTLPAALIAVGNQNVVNSTDPGVIITRNLTGAGNSHGFSDSSNFSKNAGTAYNSYDARITTSGSWTGARDHYAGFQFSPSFGHTGDPITNVYGMYLSDPAGAGAITNNYGIWISNEDRGTSLNYGVWSDGLAPSRFGQLLVGSGTSVSNGRTFDVVVGALSSSPSVATLALQGGSTGEIGYLSWFSGTTELIEFDGSVSGTNGSNITMFTKADGGTLHAALSASSSQVITMGHYGAGSATFDASGNISSVSDERLKNISGAFLPDLTVLRSVNPIIFRWKKTSGLDTKNDYAGFSAQNVRSAFGVRDAGMVTGVDKAGNYTLQDRALLAAAYVFIKKLDQRVTRLENTNRKLRKKLRSH
jgi:hypothetical protein